MREKWKKEIREWAVAIVISIIALVILRSFVFTTYVVEGRSMEPNFHDGDRMIVNKFVYLLREPKRGEVVVLHTDKSSDFIKRVVALPGEKVRVVGDDVYVNGEKIVEPYLEEVLREARENGVPYNRLDSDEIVVPEGHLFVLGDNRSFSQDSRTMGPIPISDIVGRPEFVFFPLDEMRIVRHR